MTLPPRGMFQATVIANVPLCREHYRLTLRIDGFPPTAPGQFVQLQCRDPDSAGVDHDFDWSPADGPPTLAGAEFLGRDAFLRRPFSIAGRRDVAGHAELDIIGREVGPGTRFLGTLAVGDALSVIGPLGNRFTLPNDNGIALLVGGGVGIPPMIYLAQALAQGIEARAIAAYAFAGALTCDLMPLTIRDDSAGGPGKTRSSIAELNDTPFFNVTEFAKAGVASLLTTDDGSLGAKGYVTESLDRFLDIAGGDQRRNARTTIYTCGPEPMMKRVQQIAERRGIACQIAVERAMACGMGTCQSCCIRVKKPDPAAPPLPGKEWCYRLACTDGPVFSGAELLW